MIIGLTGYKQAGKDSTADILCKEAGFERAAFADALRSMALDLNPWLYVEHDGEGGNFYHYAELMKDPGYESAKKIPSVREWLQRLGTEGVRKNLGSEAWVNALDFKLGNTDGRNIVITDCRFENEAAYVHRKGGQLWRIVREGQVNTDLHESEAHIASLPADLEIVAANLTQLSGKVLDAYDVAKQLFDTMRLTLPTYQPVIKL